ncbi:MAG: hypothetical protein F6K36_13990 [Symploca sp. SIO3C6]|uniref:Uncharacterized protein n=1 Tax=Symploca sp. SIO1C4 TaxID=2607765 RepID=A0A6B3N1S3_9CYAN|nr:hypothetical protein [Symploca sp. SIO3C6]NER27059.1 hypothetical protein [Symploca sp. SIO1C4]NET07220.1 hypothetical protein [Symploca sp. SIO2B6]
MGRWGDGEMGRMSVDKNSLTLPILAYPDFLLTRGFSRNSRNCNLMHNSSLVI